VTPNRPSRAESLDCSACSWWAHGTPVSSLRSVELNEIHPLLAAHSAVLRVPAPTKSAHADRSSAARLEAARVGFGTLVAGSARRKPSPFRASREDPRVLPCMSA